MGFPGFRLSPPFADKPRTLRAPPIPAVLALLQAFKTSIFFAKKVTLFLFPGVLSYVGTLERGM